MESQSRKISWKIKNSPFDGMLVEGKPMTFVRGRLVYEL